MTTDRSFFYALGFDPGFANFGWALTKVFSDGSVELVNLGLIQTEKASGKVLVVEDMLRRGRVIAARLESATFHCERLTRRRSAIEAASIVCCEALSYPQGKSSVAKICVSWGVMLGVLPSEIPVVQRSPQQIKKAITGHATASKKEIEASLLDPAGRFKLTNIESLLKERGLTALAKREHPVDAVGAVVASLDDEMMRVFRRMIT